MAHAHVLRFSARFFNGRSALLVLFSLAYTYSYIYTFLFSSGRQLHLQLQSCASYGDREQLIHTHSIKEDGAGAVRI